VLAPDVPQTTAQACAVHYAAVRRFIGARVRWDGAADDLTQEVMRGALECPGQPVAWSWFWQRAAFVVQDFYRTRSRRQRRLETAGHRAWWLHPEHEPSPERDVLDREGVAEVTRALSRLTDNQRAALFAPKTRGDGAAKMAALRGRQKLRALLAAQGVSA